MRRIFALADLEPAARRHLPRPLFGYVAGDVETGLAARGTRAAFEELRFVPRVLVDTSTRSTKTTLFGQVYDAPFGIAPMGISAMMAYRGDLVLARAAAAANIPAIMSATSLIPMEDVAREAPGTWFQAYLPGEKPRIDLIVDRAAAAGFGTLVVTVDVPILGNRENNLRTGFSTPLRPTPRLAWDGITRPTWLIGTALRTLLRHGMPHFENAITGRGAPIIARDVSREFGRRDGLDWSHIAYIRERWTGRLVIKGILAAEDATLAHQHGADGIIVSNHGGRQLDGAVAPLHVLPGIVAAAGDMVVMLDGGIRRGSDVLKALAFGARFVFVGRPFLYAAALAGEAGVAHAIGLLQEETNRNMALLGILAPEGMHPGMLYGGADV